MNIICREEHTASKRALVICLNEFCGAPWLEYAIRDADAVAGILTEREYLFDVTNLRNQDATADRMGTEIRALLRSDSGMKLLYFAGHGQRADGDGFMVATDNRVRLPGFSLAELRDELAAASGVVVVILDCCYAGYIYRTRGRQIKYLNGADVKSTFSGLGSSKFVLAACQADEESDESPDLEHGVFTSTCSRASSTPRLPRAA